MEVRVNTLEKEVKEIREQVRVVDSRFGALMTEVDSVEGQLRAIMEFMKEIRNLMKVGGYGKSTEAGTSSQGVGEIQSATPRAVPRPMVREDKEHEKSPKMVETTTIVTLVREEICNRRLKILIFIGEDPFSWLAKAKRYFLINGITDKEKVQSVMVCLEGASLGWLQWRENRRPFGDWA